jgi:hypothetical protein
VKPVLPYVELNFALKEKIKAMMSKRYKAKPEAFELSGFYADSGERMVMYNIHIHRLLILTIETELYCTKIMTNLGIQIYFTSEFNRRPSLESNNKCLYVASAYMCVYS